MFATFQEAFDSTVTKLAAQGMKANSEAGGCEYLNRHGNKCAIGVHLPDGHVLQKQNKFIVEACHVYPDVRDIIKIENDTSSARSQISFWNAIQEAHDRSLDLSSVRHNFKSVALQYGLDHSKIDLFTTWGVSKYTKEEILEYVVGKKGMNVEVDAPSINNYLKRNGIPESEFLPVKGFSDES